MDTAKRAIEIVEDAERRMRELVGEAVATGDYETTSRLTELARALAELGNGKVPGSTGYSIKPTEPPDSPSQTTRVVRGKSRHVQLANKQNSYCSH